MVVVTAVATPKQIREVMKVDGLTNDEVKSHLQVRLDLLNPKQDPVRFASDLTDPYVPFSEVPAAQPKGARERATDRGRGRALDPFSSPGAEAEQLPVRVAPGPAPPLHLLRRRRLCRLRGGGWLQVRELRLEMIGISLRNRGRDKGVSPLQLFLDRGNSSL